MQFKSNQTKETRTKWLRSTNVQPGLDLDLLFDVNGYLPCAFYHAASASFIHNYAILDGSQALITKFSSHNQNGQHLRVKLRL